MGIYSLKYFKMIFKQMSSEEDKDKSSVRIIAHDNLRGSDTYTGGGINAKWPHHRKIKGYEAKGNGPDACRSR